MNPHIKNRVVTMAIAPKFVSLALGAVTPLFTFAIAIVCSGLRFLLRFRVARSERPTGARPDRGLWPVSTDHTQTRIRMARGIANCAPAPRRFTNLKPSLRPAESKGKRSRKCAHMGAVLKLSAPSAVFLSGSLSQDPRPPVGPRHPSNKPSKEHTQDEPDREEGPRAGNLGCRRGPRLGCCAPG